MIDNSIEEEDLRNMSRAGRQSLTIQPQPESKILKEYRLKQQRKTMGNIFEERPSQGSSNTVSSGFLEDTPKTSSQKRDSI